MGRVNTELRDLMDEAFLEIAESAVRRTLKLVDQGKVPGYRRCTGYEDGNPARRDMGPLGGAATVIGEGVAQSLVHQSLTGRPPTEYQPQNPEAAAQYYEDVEYLLSTFRACFIGSDNPNPTIREMADCLRGMAFGDRPLRSEPPLFNTEIQHQPGELSG